MKSKNIFGGGLRKVNGKLASDGRGKRRALCAAIEPLETRQLLTAIIVNSIGDSSNDANIAGPAITLREAVNFENANGGGTIAFDPSIAGQTINLGLIGDPTFGPTALAITSNITIDGGAGGITLARDANADPTRLRLFYVTRAGDLTLNNLTLSGGLARGGNGGNGAVSGGGGAAGLGGAIVNAGTLNLLDSTLTANRAIGGNGGVGTGTSDGAVGGGLGGDGNAVAEFQGGAPNGGSPSNTGNGGFGGGGDVNPATGNGGFGGGGGIYSNGGFGGGGGYLGAGFAAGIGSENSRQGGGGGAGLGGAVFNYGGTLNITNSTLADNNVAGGLKGPSGANGQGLGGAVFNLNGIVTVNDSTFGFNIAPQGAGAIYSLGDNGIATQAGPTLPNQTATVTLNNTILSNSSNGIGSPVSDYVENTNDSGQIAQHAAGTVFSSGAANIISTLAASGNFAGSADITDPVFANFLSSNGGPTQTIPLDPTSPAIDAGDNALIPAGVIGDQRGFLPRIVNGAVDIGAYEYGAAQFAATSTVVSASEPSPTFGDDLTFTAIVSSPGGLVPTGSVQFFIDGSSTAFDNEPLTNGQAVSTGIDNLSATGHSVSAVYTPAGNFFASNSDPLSFVITPAPTTTAVSDASGVYTGSPFIATGTVTGAGGLSTVPTSFTYVGTDATSYAATSTAPTNAGTYSVVASYIGDANHGPSSSSALPFAITVAPTTTTVADAGGVYTGSSFAATGTVTAADGLSTVPTSFTYAGTGATSYAATATAPTNVGTYSVTATYIGDANHGPSSSGALSFAITPAPSTTTVADAGGIYTGSPFAATGTVTAADGLSTVPTSFTYVGTGATSYAATATAPTNAGTYSVVASYIGDANHGPSSSGALSFAITPAPSTTTVADAGGIYTGSPFAATGTVTAADGLSTVPTSFTYVGTGATSYAATATAPTNAGTYSVVASYTGDANHGPSSSSALPFAITVAPSVTTVADAGGVYTGSSFAATGTVTATDGLSAVPTSFSYAGTGATSYTATTSAPTMVGTYSVTATYIGDPNHGASSSAALSFAITPAKSTTTVADAGGVYTGSPFAATGTVTATDGLSTVPTSFSYAGTGATSYPATSTAPTNVGTYSVTATYIGDVNHGASSSAPLPFAITAPNNLTVTWNAPSPIAYFTPLSSTQLNATASLLGTFAYTPVAGTLLSVGTQTLSVTFTPTNTNYSPITRTVPLVVLGPGVYVIGTQLYCIGGSSTFNDHLQVHPIGSSTTGATGVNVQTQLNGVNTQTNYSQSFSTINVFMQNGNENIQFAPSLTMNVVICVGNGADNIQLGNGNDLVTLGNGNDNIQGGAGVNVIAVGNGNDNVTLGNGSNNVVTIGTGNDNVIIGNGNDNTVIVPAAGNPNAKIKFGTGGNNTIQAG